MTIAALADQAGVFDLLAVRVAALARGHARALYLGVFALGVLITAFLSNDATALILTPVVYTLVTRLRLPVLPFMFACTFIADTASFLLPVSNPTNILLTDAFGRGLAPFLHYLLVPALTCIAVNMAVFAVVFRGQVGLTYETQAVQEAASAPLRRYALIVLGLVAAAYLTATALGLPVSLVGLGGGALLLVCALHWRQLNWRRLGRDISWPLFGFIAGFFVMVQGISRLGVLLPLGQLLAHLATSGSYSSVLAVGAAGAVGANLINNIPMTLLLIGALHSVPHAVAVHPALVYAAILGVDLGPNLTTVGSLATMLWLVLLRRRGLDITAADYLKLGMLTIPAMLAISAWEVWVR